MENNKYNTIMPESDDNALCILIDKPISAEEHDKNLLPRLQNIIARQGKVRLLVYFKDFKGWEEEAAIRNMIANFSYGPKMERVALVNPPPKEMIRAKIRSTLFNSELRFFATKQLEEALHWVKADNDNRKKSPASHTEGN